MRGRSSRRRFLSIVALLQLPQFVWRGRQALAADASSDAVPARIEATLAAFVDTLLPADELTPAASELGIVDRIVAEAAGDALYTKLIAVGSAFLDRAAEGRFASSNPRVRNVIVEWMSQADYDEVPRRFYTLIRQRAVELYYSDPRSWPGLAISRPPQPIGYPDHWK